MAEDSAENIALNAKEIIIDGIPREARSHIYYVDTGVENWSLDRKTLGYLRKCWEKSKWEFGEC